MSSPLDGQGARHKDSYYLMSDEKTTELRDTDAVFRRLKADFLRIARNRRRRDLSRSESSGSPSPVRRQLQQRSTNLPKFKIATFYSTDVELWFNQIETQFDLHQITAFFEIIYMSPCLKNNLHLKICLVLLILKDSKYTSKFPLDEIVKHLKYYTFITRLAYFLDKSQPEIILQ